MSHLKKKIENKLHNEKESFDGLKHLTILLQ